VLVTFLYTHCVDVCPLVASALNDGLRSLPPSARSHVRVLAVSVDPAHDTPAAVRRFVAEHRLLPQFRYLTGTLAQLRPVWQAYNVLTVPGTNRVSHSAFTVLVDPHGLMRAYFDSSVTSSAVLRNVRAVLPT
jgi:protein SCO1/2